MIRILPFCIPMSILHVCTLAFDLDLFNMIGKRQMGSPLELLLLILGL